MEISSAEDLKKHNSEAILISSTYNYFEFFFSMKNFKNLCDKILDKLNTLLTIKVWISTSTTEKCQTTVFLVVNISCDVKH